MAHLAALCRGDRAIRDRARLYVDRVKMWELQGNARSTQNITSGVVPACVWLASDACVVADSLGSAVLTKSDMMKASGLSPGEFDRAVDLLRPVVAMEPAPRQRRVSSQVPQTLAKPRLSQSELLEKAKQVQVGTAFEKNHQAQPPPPPPAAAAAPTAASAAHVEPAADSLLRLRDSLEAEKAQHAEPRPAERQAVRGASAEPQKPRSRGPRARTRAPPQPTHQQKPAAEPEPEVQWMSAEDENAMWAKILGKRIGIGRTEEPRRKRGRPPGTGVKKAAPVPPPPTLPPPPEGRSLRYPPPRYRTLLPLDEKELHMLRPLPIPLVMSTCDPSLPSSDALRVWNRWRASM
ncbi:hypothetical protein MCUN1_000583 [Malassezia cuniculi]|uniref:Uncharacterized protein n=1 Tax=Malassezia cuniculi TaxID=948313 RepID=A0AAF0J9X9_9BASI|nr:hypothetical protein MCUN1_000583 [Malassezia cuniculi]